VIYDPYSGYYYISIECPPTRDMLVVNRKSGVTRQVSVVLRILRAFAEVQCRKNCHGLVVVRAKYLCVYGSGDLSPVILALAGCEWSPSPVRKVPQYALNRRLGEPQEMRKISCKCRKLNYDSLVVEPVAWLEV
jgi:hypothetical protein